MRSSDFQGPAGEAWTMALEPRTPAHYAAVYGALIRAPQAHPLWAWHVLHVVSLRDIVGVRPAKKHYPGAEYEISVFAIHPDKTPDPDKPPFDLLEPYNVCEQFHGIDINHARMLGVHATRACVEGLLVPDSDYRLAWRKVIGDTVECMRTVHGGGA